MKKIINLIWICLIAFSANAQDTKPVDTDETDNGWEFDLAPYVWVADLSADISFLDQSTVIEAQFKDVLNNLKMGFLMHAEARHDNWFIAGDIVYLAVEKNGDVDVVSISTNTTLSIKQTVAEITGGYTFVESEDWLFVDGFAGFRYFGIQTEIEAGSQELLDETINTTDPIIGMRLRTVSDKWQSSLRADIGGFGIGSEFSWKTNLLLGYQFSELFSLHGGFQAYGIDYKKDDFGLEMTSAGFLLGGNFHL